MKIYKGRTFKDPNLSPCYFANRSEAQSVFLQSVLHERYIGEIDQIPTIEVKPGKAKMCPHQYYVGHTRDGSPFRGGWITGEALESLAKGSIDTNELDYSRVILPS